MSGARQPLIRLPGAARLRLRASRFWMLRIWAVRCLTNWLRFQQIAHGARFTRIDIPLGQNAQAQQVRKVPGIGCIAAVLEPVILLDRCRVPPDAPRTLPPADHRPASTS